MSNYITPCTDVLLMLDAEVAKRTTAPVLKSIVLKLGGSRQPVVHVTA